MTCLPRGLSGTSPDPPHPLPALGPWGEFPSRPQPCCGRQQQRPHLGRGGATHDAGQHLDHVDGNGVRVLVQHLAGRAVRSGALQLAAPCSTRGAGPGAGAPGPVAERAWALGTRQPRTHQALYSSPNCSARPPHPRALSEPLGKSHSDQEAREGAKAGKLMGRSPPIPTHARHTCRQASRCPPPRMIDRGPGNGGQSSQNVGARRTFETLESAPPLPLGPRGDTGSPG